MAGHESPSNSETIEAQKRELRALAKARRSDAHSNLGALAAERIKQRALVDLPIPKSASVSGFWPIGEEIDARPLLEALYGLGHAIGLPVVMRRGEPLQFRTWRPGDALLPGGFGTRVPRPERPIVIPEVLLVPLLAFDRAGYRLGYGGGFYDRTLATLRRSDKLLAVGLAYSAQEVPRIPRDPYDQRLDYLVTELETLRF